MKLILLFFVSFPLWAQMPGMGLDEDLNVGSDIFSDFNEDLEAAQVMEDERFYRYGRFFSVNVGLGYTTFTGNRGAAYPDNAQNGPSWNFSLMYFRSFQSAFTIGLEYSTHTMILDTRTIGNTGEKVGLVRTTLLRPFFGFRYYIDTADLGTAITYSNPYLAGRIEYWYQTNEYPESKNLSTKTGGGIGTAMGAGLEFPIELKKSYFNVELLYHFANFFDKFTADYQRNPKDSESTYGYNDLTGDAITLMFAYSSSW